MPVRRSQTRSTRPPTAEYAVTGPFLEHRLAMEQHGARLLESILQRGGLRSQRRGEGVRVDLGQREVPERKANGATESLLDAPDLPERPARIRALVIAVLDDQVSRRAAAHVIDRV